MEGVLQDCPFCGYHPETENHLLMHMEEHHSEDGPSPFVVQDGEERATKATVQEEGDFFECPRCGEEVMLAEFDDHVGFHEAEEEDDLESFAPSDCATDDQSPPAATDFTREYHSPYGGSSRDDVPEVIRKYGYKTADHSSADTRNFHSGATDRWKNILKLPSTISRHGVNNEVSSNGQHQRKRLGKDELGKYANEDAMPQSLVSLLRRKGQISQSGVVYAIGRLLQISGDTEYAYLCNPAVDHVSKLSQEGGFCGYRNIQMLSSYIIGARAEGAHHFQGKLPSVFDIQEYIETAWDKGINAQGRIETGGVRGTRKYIGTPEAQAMFLSLQIPCNAQGFKDVRPGNAEARLLDHIEQYFHDGNSNLADKVRRTTLPPIYFQHRGHSLTIVGFEKKRDGSRELIVFDPMFHDSDKIKDLHNIRHIRTRSVSGLMKAYRRGNRYLRRYHEFEILKLTSRLPDSEAEEAVDLEDYSTSENLMVSSGV